MKQSKTEILDVEDALDHLKEAEEHLGDAIEYVGTGPNGEADEAWADLVQAVTGAWSAVRGARRSLEPVVESEVAE